jgi:tetratricopeptide (TPR) repeat protein/CHAT domain-containing protein
MTAQGLMACFLLLPGTAPVQFRDAFAANRLDTYRVTGTVTWRPGALALDRNAALGRPLAAGDPAEVRAVLGFPPQPAAGELRVGLIAAGGEALVALRRNADRTELVSLLDVKQVVALPNSPGPWAVRVSVRRGLVRARAWPLGDAEPTAWQSVRYLGKSTWRPEAVAVLAGPKAGGVVTALEAWSLPPLPPTPDQQKQLREAAALHRQGRTAYGQGRLDEALAKERAALQLRRQAQPQDQSAVAECASNVGLLLHALGKYRDARPYLEEALALYRKGQPADHPDLAFALNNLGELLRGLGHLDQARTLLEEALATRRRALPALHRDTAVSLNNFGLLLGDLNEHDTARTHLEEALALRRRLFPAGHTAIADALSNLGTLLHAVGRLEQARTCYDEALAIVQKSLPPQHPDLAISLNNLACLLQDQGQLDRARVLFEKVLALRRKSLPPGHPDLAISLNNLGLLLRELGQPREARPLLEEALALRRRALPSGHPDLGHSLNNLGSVLRDLGEFDEARAHFEQALVLYKKALPALHPDRAHTLNHLGTLLHAAGQLDEARTCYEEALAIRRKVLPSLHPDIAISLSNRGRLSHERGQTVAAWRDLLESVATWSGYAGRVAYGSAERDHLALIGRQRWLLDIFLSLADHTGDLTAGQCREILARLLDGKALSTAVVSARHQAVLLGSDAEALAQFEQMRQVRQQLADLLLQGPGRLQPAPYRDLCDQLQQRQDRLERRLGERTRAFAALTRAARAGPAEVAERFGPGDVLVELIRYRRWDFLARDGARLGKDRYAAVLLWRGEPGARFVTLGEAGPIDEAIRAWRVRVQRGIIHEPSERTLRERMWEPLARALPAQTAGLIVAPDGELALVPFEALRLADGKYLVEKLAIRYVASGRDLLARPQPKAKSAVALVLADPDYESLLSGGRQPPGATAQGADAPRSGGLRFAPLPGFAREADAVARLLRDQSGWEVRPLRRQEASEEALAKVPRPRLLYCVTHGFFLQDLEPPPPPGMPGRKILVQTSGKVETTVPALSADPRLRSGLALAGANRWRERSAKGLSDGLLTALEVENLDLWGTELVVLSACETGRGEVQVGEGVLGLRRAFQLAGAQTVLASLWQVPDQETEQLMTDCLGRWLKSKAPAAALRQAQLELIHRLRQGPTPRLREAPPLYWAGFICHGQDR